MGTPKEGTLRQSPKHAPSLPPALPPPIPPYLHTTALHCPRQWLPICQLIGPASRAHSTPTTHPLKPTLPLAPLTPHPALTLLFTAATTATAEMDSVVAASIPEVCGRAIESVVKLASHGARHVMLNAIMRDKISSALRSEMVSHRPLLEAGLCFLATHYSKTVELLHAKGNEKDTNRPSEEIVSSLCTLLEGGSLWGLNIGEWEFSPLQIQRIHTAARSHTCRLCFAFMDAVLVGQEAADELRAIIRSRRRNTRFAPWLYGDDPAWNAIIHAECTMWFQPKEVRRNKELEATVPWAAASRQRRRTRSRSQSAPGGWREPKARLCSTDGAGKPARAAAVSLLRGLDRPAAVDLRRMSASDLLRLHALDGERVHPQPGPGTVCVGFLVFAFSVRMLVNRCASAASQLPWLPLAAVAATLAAMTWAATATIVRRCTQKARVTRGRRPVDNPNPNRASRARRQLPTRRVHEHMAVAFEVGDAERRAVRSHMRSGVPLVIRGTLPAHKRAVLLSSWRDFVARSDDALEYSTNQGPRTDRTDGGSTHTRGKLTLREVWTQPVRLESSLGSVEEPNPVHAWLCDDERVRDARNWCDALGALLRSRAPAGSCLAPAFVTGTISPGGGPTHYDDFDSIATVLVGTKTFYVAPYDTFANSPRMGEENERLGVSPFDRTTSTPTQWSVAELNCGDTLFLPAGYWHFVDSNPHTVMTNTWRGRPEIEVGTGALAEGVG